MRIFSGIYACVCQDPFCAQLSREHNDALTAEKYVRRRDKVKEINDTHCK